MRLASSFGSCAAVIAVIIGATRLHPARTSPAQMITAFQFSPVLTTIPPDPVADWMSAIESMEMRGEYATLDHMAVRLRNVDVRFAGGEPKITSFYAALGDFTGCTCPSPRQSLVKYEAKQRAVTAWMEAAPRSPTAPVVMAKLLRQYAWLIRGHEFANSTDAARLEKFRDITHRSIKFLQPLDPTSDPAIYVGLLSAARGNDDGRSEMDRVFPLAVMAFPTYYPYYENESDLLQERWFGAPDEAGRFLASLPALGDTGLVAYADAVSRLDESNTTSDLPAIFRIDWKTLQRAFDARRRLYDTDDDIRNEEMKLAVVFGDRTYARTLLGKIGAHWTPMVWRQRAKFDQAVAWIHAGVGLPPRFD